MLLEYVTATGSYIPTFEMLNGQKITLPDGKRVPPWNAPLAAVVIVMLEIPPASIGFDTKVGL